MHPYPLWLQNLGCNVHYHNFLLPVVDCGLLSLYKGFSWSSTEAYWTCPVSSHTEGRCGCVWLVVCEASSLAMWWCLRYLHLHRIRTAVSTPTRRRRKIRATGTAIVRGSEEFSGIVGISDPEVSPSVELIVGVSVTVACVVRMNSVYRDIDF